VSQNNTLSQALQLAGRQHAAITRAQLRHCGFSDDQIDHLVETGWIKPAARAVFVLAGSKRTWQQAVMVAVLAGPPGTSASYMTAGALLGLCGPPALPHVTVPKGRSGRTRAALAHHAILDPRDRLVIDGIPCTSAARTLLDCASVLDRSTLEDLADTALCNGRTSVAAVEAALQRATGRNGRPGGWLLRSVLAAWAGPISPDSPAEIRLLRKVEEWGYPRPERQVAIRDETGAVIAYADLGWPDRQIGLDYDSLRWHNPRAWAHDELRHHTVTIAGWALLHPEKADLLPGETAFRDALDREWRAHAPHNAIALHRPDRASPAEGRKNAIAPAKRNRVQARTQPGRR